MNKTAIKNFAVWERKKLISEIIYKAGLLGITEKGVADALPQSTKDLQFFNIGTKDYTQISKNEIKQRNVLVSHIKEKEKSSDYKTAFQSVVEEVAYTWFNRLIAVRFMEVNDYLPSRIRVLSSENFAKSEPDFVTSPFDTDLEFSAYERDRVMQLKDENKLDELFRMLFIKQCNKLNEILPELFEKTDDYTELLLNISFTDKEGVLYHLAHDIDEIDFKEAVEIIGWMYQYYNTEPKDETFALLKKNVKITKERIPAATQLFTPDWIVRYMVENSLGRLWIEGHSNDTLKSEWKYFLDEAEQEPDVKAQFENIRAEYKNINPEDIKVIDPCMGSGHILVYAFEVLIQIYESCGYTARDSASHIIEKNIFGLDIDDRAYQLSYFAIMMKGRKYDRRFLTKNITPNLCSIQESNGFNKEIIRFISKGNEEIKKDVTYILEIFTDAKEYGSILDVNQVNFNALEENVIQIEETFYDNLFDNLYRDEVVSKFKPLLKQAKILAQRYDAVITNPPYMGGKGITPKLAEFLKSNYNSTKSDLFAAFITKSYELARNLGYISMVTPQSWMFLSTFEKLRHEMVSSSSLVNMCHLGTKAFECGFGTTAFSILKKQCDKYIGTYLNLVDYLDEELKENQFFNENNKFLKNIELYKHLPNTIFAYWCSPQLENLFTKCKLLEDIVTMDCGIKTGNNEQFIRLWYEVEATKICLNNATYEKTCEGKYKWFKYNKGGGFRKWYGGYEYVVNLENDARDIRNTVSKDTYRLRNKSNYFCQGVLWPLIGDNSFSARLLPKDVLIDVTSNAIFMKTVDYYLIAYLNSNIYNEMLNMVNPTVSYPIDSIGKVPYVDIEEKQIIENLAKENTEIAVSDWDELETSWDFTSHPLIKYSTKLNINKLDQICLELQKIQSYRVAKVLDNENIINQIFYEGLKLNNTKISSDQNNMIHKADLERDIKSFVSYAVGCMFGRYSHDVDGLAYAGGDWNNNNFKTYIPDSDNCIPITDEEYFEDDIVGRFVDFIKTVFSKETLEENLDFIAKAIGNKGNTSREVIRNYFIKDFYKDHCKTYQKRPIYWMFDNGKEDGFKALIYMHRYNADTIGNMRIEYLHRMQKVYENEIVHMQEVIDNSTNTRDVVTAEKRKGKLIKQLKETKDYDQKVAHLALARIEIDLDDGVVVNYEKVQTGTDGKKLDVLGKI